MDTLIAAVALFLGLHLIPSTPIRGWLRTALGEGVYLGLFSLASAAGLVWMAVSYGRAPYVELWAQTAALTYVPAVVMPLAFVLLVCGNTVRNPTAVKGEKHLEARDPAPGILKVTRHPILWAIALWALSHLAPNGDVASVLFFGSLAGLALIGMALQDARKAKELGAAWGPFALTTSAVPFLAALQGRAQPSLKEIGAWRILAGVGAYAAVVALHETLIGVPPFLP